jgi:hypothetical protein
MISTCWEISYCGDPDRCNALNKNKTINVARSYITSMINMQHSDAIIAGFRSLSLLSFCMNYELFCSACDFFWNFGHDIYTKEHI